MVSNFHGKIVLAQGIHGFVSIEYDNATERLANTDFVTEDRYKIAYQIDNGTFWCLVDETVPTWTQIGNGLTPINAQYTATAATNTIDSSSTANFLAITGSNFSEVSGDPSLTFTAASCLITYNGISGRNLLVTATATVEPASAPGGNADFNIGIDFDGDLIGTNGATSFDPSVQSAHLFNDAKREFMCQRIISPTNGQTFQPTLSYDDGVDITINKFNLTVIEV